MADFCLPFYRETVSAKEPTTVLMGDQPLTIPDMGFVNAKVAEFCRQQTMKVDSTFGDSLDIELFDLHFAALRFECFSLAWRHSFLKKPKASLAQTALLYEYLVRNERPDVWAAMLDHYSQAVARSADGGLDPGKPSSQSTLLGHNQERVKRFGEFVALGYPTEICAHVLNQYFTEDRAEKVPVYLTFELLRCVGKMTEAGAPSIAGEAVAVLVGTITGMYDEPKSRLAMVEIVD
jgi:hypothetical protein